MRAGLSLDRRAMGTSNELQELPNRPPLLHGVPHRPIEIDGIHIPSTFFLNDHIAFGNEVMKESLDGAFRNSNTSRQVSDATLWISPDADQHMRMV